MGRVAEQPVAPCARVRGAAAHGRRVAAQPARGLGAVLRRGRAVGCVDLLDLWRALFPRRERDALVGQHVHPDAGANTTRLN